MSKLFLDGDEVVVDNKSDRFALLEDILQELEDDYMSNDLSAYDVLVTVSDFKQILDEFISRFLNNRSNSR